MEEERQFMLTDLHVHTSDFSDGEMSLAVVLEMARAKGVRVGIADHWIYGMETAEELERYLDTLDRYPVYKGLEVSLGHPSTAPPELLSRLDYIIGSIHDLEWRGERRFFELGNYFRYILGENPDYRGADPIWEPAALESILRVYLHAIETQPMTILGHSTLLPPLFLKNPEEILPEGWSERLISAVVAKGIAIEISGAWKLPHREFLKKALDMGAIFSFGSDAHRDWMVGALDYPIGIADEVGIPEERIYVPKRRI